ncbi:hypothetical protein BS78_05G286100 [Paspalum vaginatum]|nr:hypothetical protein BS78_05G286100 [Paspalum vaginatum]
MASVAVDQSPSELCASIQDSFAKALATCAQMKEGLQEIRRRLERCEEAIPPRSVTTSVPPTMAASILPLQGRQRRRRASPRLRRRGRVWRPSPQLQRPLGRRLPQRGRCPRQGHLRRQRRRRTWLHKSTIK